MKSAPFLCVAAIALLAFTFGSEAIGAPKKNAGGAKSQSKLTIKSASPVKNEQQLCSGKLDEIGGRLVPAFDEIRPSSGNIYLAVAISVSNVTFDEQPKMKDATLVDQAGKSRAALGSASIFNPGKWTVIDNYNSAGSSASLKAKKADITCDTTWLFEIGESAIEGAVLKYKGVDYHLAPFLRRAKAGRP